MKILVPDHILASLRGKEVESLCHAQYMFGLTFVGGDQLNVSGRFKFGKRGTSRRLLDFPLSNSRLVQVLGSTITAVSHESDGTIHLDFENDTVLTVDASYPGYDAYALVIDGKEYRV